MSSKRIEWSSVKAYNEAFPNEKCRVFEPGTLLVIITSEGKMYSCDFFDEPDSAFRERLDRSKADNHNYFIDEWKEYKQEKKNGVIY